MKPRVFVGSSLESLEYARAVQENLSRDAEVTVWDQGLLAISSSVLDTLFAALSGFDFAIFVFSPDDVLRIRGRKVQAVRDNVVFELGLFIGKLGRSRSFILVPEQAKQLHLPSDLMGLLYSSFDPSRIDRNLIAAMGPACNQIRMAMSDLARTSAGAIPLREDYIQDLYLSAYQIYHQFYRQAPEIEVLEHKYEFTIDTSGN